MHLGHLLMRMVRAPTGHPKPRPALPCVPRCLRICSATRCTLFPAWMLMRRFGMHCCMYWFHGSGRRLKRTPGPFAVSSGHGRWPVSHWWHHPRSSVFVRRRTRGYVGASTKSWGSGRGESVICQQVPSTTQRHWTLSVARSVRPLMILSVSISHALVTLSGERRARMALMSCFCSCPTRVVADGLPPTLVGWNMPPGVDCSLS